MHARDLVELAAVVAAQGPVLVRGAPRLSPSALEQYWVASKCRLDRWGRALRGFQRGVEAEAGGRIGQWPRLCGVLEEVLTGEMLTRVWTAVLCAHDRTHHGGDAEPIARSVLIGHLEARHRSLGLLVRWPAIDAEAAVRLNHLRRRSERWTDLLVGHLSVTDDLAEFAFDPRRAGDFARDIRERLPSGGGRRAWLLTLAALRAAFRDALRGEPVNPDLNRAVASSILACFPAEQFDSIGVFRSLWLLRLTNAARDAQGMIEDLLGPDPARHGGGSSGRNSPPEPETPQARNRLQRFGGQGLRLDDDP